MEQMSPPCTGQAVGTGGIMKWTNVTRMLTTSVAAAILSVALASCGGSDSGATDAGASSGHGNDASAAGGADPKVGRTFCSAIKEVQSQ
ncbi:hypothetical protein, partial [Aeromicrobium sp.]|uniref:hypothetical protein n=1 Tax=Aeromicrobium sp. TaxID=1871063 RepID=UPI003C37596C